MVVTVGLTDLEFPVTVPMLLSMDKEVALVVLHDKVEDCPEVMPEGEAVKELITGAGGGGKLKVVKVKSGEEVLLLLPSMDVTLK